MSELVTTDPTGGRLVAWAEAARAAHQLAQSLVRTTIVPDQFRLKPGMNPTQLEQVAADATAALLLGDELGLTPIASLRALYVIRGQVGMYARAKVALVKAQGHSIWTEEETDAVVTVAGHRAGEPDHIERSSWTLERAERAGFVRRGRNGELSQYELQPRAMLYARAASDVANRVAPDALMGIPEDAEEPAAPGAPAVAPTQVMQRQPRTPAAPRELARAITEHQLPPEVDSAPLGAGGTVRSEAEPAPDVTHQEGPAQPLEPTQAPLDLPDVPAGPELITERQRAMLHALYRAQGMDRSDYLTEASQHVGRVLGSTNELTTAEASELIDMHKSH